MTKLILLAGAAAMLAGAPAMAKPGHGKGHGAKAKAHSTMPTRHHSARDLRDSNRNGIADRDEALARKYGGALCPPGLAKKTPACVPPGQAKRMWREGQRLSPNYRYYTPYDDIPFALRDRYDLSNDYRYIYRDNVIYVVDPTTRLISNVIDAIL